jgi:hypothetical protein
MYDIVHVYVGRRWVVRTTVVGWLAAGGTAAGAVRGRGTWHMRRGSRG